MRDERFREALEIIRLLWQGGCRSYQGKFCRSYQGKYRQLEDARVFGACPEDPDGFTDFFARELAEPLRQLTPNG